MRKLSLLIVVVLATAGMAMAQLTLTQGTTDVLGAHNGYGRGCVMCHAPHGGPAGNGVTSTDSTAGQLALWGEDLTPLYGKTFNFGDSGGYPVTLPANGTAITSFSNPTAVILYCLSCHDGVVAKPSMMTGQTVETIPVGSGHASTLLGTGTGGTEATNAYNNQHPVGPSAYVSCNGSVGGGAVTTASESGYNWDCTGGGNSTSPIVAGTNQKLFMTNYPGSFWNNTRSPLANYGTTVNGVTCTSCHDQHSMNVYTNSKGSFNTSFFIRGSYVPTTGGNNVAQFCRNCHGGESNEMHGLTGVPTT